MQLVAGAGQPAVTEHMSFRTQVLLSLQRALWDAVTADLLVVAVGWTDGCIRARFIYEGQITPRQKKS